MNIEKCGTSCGYINSLIGGFILIIQGFLTIIATAEGAKELRVVGGMSFLVFSEIYWLNGLIMLLLGVLVLLLIWKWLQNILKINPLIKDTVWVNVVFILIGFITGGAGGLFVLSGGILYFVGQAKATTTTTTTTEEI